VILLKWIFNILSTWIWEHGLGWCPWPI